MIFLVCVCVCSVTVFYPESPSAEPLTSVADVQESSTVEGDKPMLPRSQSERLLVANRDYVLQEKELREKYHETIYSTVEKIMKTSQSNQMKMLKMQLDRDTAELMRRLESDRREEVKALAKKHRDRDELVRVKREVDRGVVDRGVTEREKLEQAYEHRKEELHRQHEAVRNAFGDHREKVSCRFLSLVLSHFF